MTIQLTLEYRFLLTGEEWRKYFPSCEKKNSVPILAESVRPVGPNADHFNAGLTGQVPSSI
jgi:hypothetical protein